MRRRHQAAATERRSDAAGRALRVCHLAYTFYETDNRVVRYARALADRGDGVDVIALRRPGQSRAAVVDGVRVARIQHRTKSEANAWVYLLKILFFTVRALIVLSVRQVFRPYHVVHVHNVPDFLVFAAIVPKLAGAAVILDIHDILPELYRGKFGAGAGSAVFQCLLQVERLSSRFADRVIVANDIWRERLVRRAVAPSKCTTILNCPDLRSFKPRSRPNDNFTILYPGSLSCHQGLDVAIRAFAAVKGRMGDAELHIYGEGPARAELTQLARQLGLDTRLKIMPPVPVEQVCGLIASADLGIEPKLGEGFSNEALSTKILEFMAAGVPVVASRTLAHSHYFDDSVLRFFTPGDQDELAGAMCDAYQRGPDPACVERARRVAAMHDWQHRVADYYDVIDSVCGRRPGQPSAH